MRSFQAFFLSVLCLFTSKSLAYEVKEGNVNATLGPYFYRTYFPGSSTGAKSPVLTGLGLIANGDFSESESLEIGMFHMHKRFFRDVGPYVLGERTEMVYITLGYRKWFTPRFSIGTSFFSSYTMGVPVEIHRDFSTEIKVDTSARDTTEYGLDFSLQAELWSDHIWGVVLDGRYSLSVTPKSREYADHFGAILGVRYFIQGKGESQRDD